MEEVSLLEALHRMYCFCAKRKSIRFEVTFDDGINQRAAFGKWWSPLKKQWSYEVREGPYTPVFVYGEQEAVSAIMSIPGMALYGNKIRYHIYQK